MILATGHSAKDVYRFLEKEGIRVEAKDTAVGVRIEHPQSLIDSMQYHSDKGRGLYLPPATYSFVTQKGDAESTPSACVREELWFLRRRRRASRL